MPKPFYSGTDAELATGSANLVSIVTAVPVSWGLTAGIVASYAAMSANYNSLLAIATAPATRTSIAISNKDAARRLLRATSVNVAKIITATPTVNNGQLLSLGLNGRTVPSPRPVPAEAPNIEVVSVAGRIVNTRVHDSTSSRRGKPFGAVAANVYSFVGNAAPTDPREYHFEGATTRVKTQILFPNSVTSGATVWLSAAWVNARGQTSPPSTPMSFTLQGGAVLPEAA